MLYDFHQKQNAKKPESIHATYHITGTPRIENVSSGTGVRIEEDGDSIMQSSPFPSSYPEPEPLPEFNIEMDVEKEDKDAEPGPGLELEPESDSDSIPEGIPTTLIMLATEEELEGMCNQHNKVK
jgi:DNA polymerase delta subunit 3